MTTSTHDTPLPGRPVRDAADRIAEAAEAAREAIEAVRANGLKVTAKTKWGDFSIVIEENKP